MGLFNFLFGSSEVDTTPSTNVDGTSMCGSIDVNGNPYGVTDTSDYSPSVIDDAFDTCSMDASFSSFDVAVVGLLIGSK